ncbi:MAG: AMP-binding protein [Actinomycetota bacterium]
MNIGLAIARNAVRRPTDTAVFGDLTHTWASLDERTDRIANHLLSLGLERGDRVAFLVANRPEVVEVLGGVAKAGLIYVGLNFRLGPVELEQVFDNAEPSLVITDTEHLPAVRALADHVGIEVEDIDTDAWTEALAGAPASPPPTLHEVRHDDDFCIVYTSGTTGRPKGVLFDHARALHREAAPRLLAPRGTLAHGRAGRQQRRVRARQRSGGHRFERGRALRAQPPLLF